MDHPRICLFCKYFWMNEGWEGSESTGGDDPSIGCSKDKVGLDIRCGDDYTFNKKTWRDVMLTALTCEHFEEE